MKLSGITSVLAGLSLTVAACTDSAPTETKQTEAPASAFAAPSVDQKNAVKFTTSKSAPSLLTATATANLVSNGGFEVGASHGGTTISGWSTANGGWAGYSTYAGSWSPISGFGVPVPPGGTYAAMADQIGPGYHILYQDITIPAAGADLDFDLFIGNRYGTFITPSDITLGTWPNQQFRMDIVSTSASITDMGTGVLANVYKTNVGDAAVMTGYTHISASLDQFAGQTIRLRFASVETEWFFQVGVDNVMAHPQNTVDIKPGSATNPVNLNANGTLPVVILSDANFDATTITASSITLGDNSGTETSIEVNRNGVIQASTEDVDGDGDLDFVAHFSIPTLVSNGDLTSTTTRLYINGSATGGTVEGSDVVAVND
jgi:hypothetical protein